MIYFSFIYLLMWVSGELAPADRPSYPEHRKCDTWYVKCPVEIKNKLLPSKVPEYPGNMQTDVTLLEGQTMEYNEGHNVVLGFHRCNIAHSGCHQQNAYACAAFSCHICHSKVTKVQN